MADMHLWVKGFAHYIAFGGSKVAKTTFSTFIILAHEGPHGEQLKFWRTATGMGEDTCIMRVREGAPRRCWVPWTLQSWFGLCPRELVVRQF